MRQTKMSTTDERQETSMTSDGNDPQETTGGGAAVSTAEMDEMYEMASEETGATPPDWSSLTVAALKAALVERGLMTTGRKADLVARLSGASRDPGIEHAEETASTTANDALAMTSATEDVSQENLPLEELPEGGVDVGVESMGKPAAVAHEAPEPEDEGADVDEFVEWNEDLDHDGITKVSDESGVEAIVQVVDEVKDGDEKKPEAAEVAVAGDKDEEGVEEGDVKLTTDEGAEMSVDVHRDRDLFYLTWQSKKITVPFKAEIAKDLETFYKLQTVVVYPVTTADLYADIVRKHVEVALNVHTELLDIIPGKPIKGYLKLKFGSVENARIAFEDLRSLREEINVKFFSRDDSESNILSTMRKEEVERRGPTIYRLMYVGNLPASATEAALRELFPEAIEVVIPCSEEETAEQLGYAYIGFSDEQVASEMATKYKDVEMDGNKLYVIRAIAEKKEKFGLLRDSLRMYWSEQTFKLQKIIDRPHSRPKWEVADAEQKMTVLRRRLDKDKRRREELRLPCPDFQPAKDDSALTAGMEAGRSPPSSPDEKDRSARKDDSRSSRGRYSSPLRLSTSPRRRTGSPRARSRSSKTRSPVAPRPRRSPPPPRRQEYNRSRATGRNGPNYSQSRREEVADKLVNQLQGLVSALTHKLPTVEPPRPLLETLQFGAIPPAFLDDRRQLSAATNAYRGATGYGASSSSFDMGQGSSRYTSSSSSGKRYGDDSYGNDKRRRTSDYGNQSSGGNRYSGGGQSYNDDRYGSGRRDNSQGGSRQYNNRSAKY